MSLYGPKINLPKVSLPSSSGPSWNLEKEKKIGLLVISALVIIIALWFIVPIAWSALTEGIDSILNPAIQINWKNNPLDLTKETKEAELDLIITNTTKEVQELVTFNITTPSNEIIIFCPPSLYNTEKQAFMLENLSPGDKRKVPCIVRRNSAEAVFTGNYSIEINTTLGKAKTALEIISK
jgi:hypothetical protein